MVAAKEQQDQRPWTGDFPIPFLPWKLHNPLMRPSEALRAHGARIRQIALSHRVREVRVFGSAVRGDDSEGSDLDLLVEPTAETTLMDIGAIRLELKQLLGLDVDVLTPGSLPDRWRADVLREARPL